MEAQECPIVGNYLKLIVMQLEARGLWFFSISYLEMASAANVISNVELFRN